MVWHVLVELDDAEGLWELEGWVPRHPQCHFQARILLERERAHLVLSSAELWREYHRRRSVCQWYKVEWKGIRQRSEREVCSISNLFPIVSLGEYDLHKLWVQMWERGHLSALRGKLEAQGDKHSLHLLTQMFCHSLCARTWRPLSIFLVNWFGLQSKHLWLYACVTWKFLENGSRHVIQN